jgi:hypothetical protein
LEVFEPKLWLKWVGVPQGCNFPRNAYT